MINEIRPYTFKNEYRNIEPRKEDIALIYKDTDVLLKKYGDLISFPKISELIDKDLKFEYRFLFTIDSINYFLIELKKIVLLDDFNFQSISIFRNSSPKHLSFAGITGYQLYKWYEKNKYCGKCGTKMYHSLKSRTMVCPNCNDTRYPFLAPAVIVAIVNNDKILVTKYAHRKLSNYALVAGYAEIGESIEETVMREVKEEVGLNVKNIKYYKSQPWSFSGSLLFGFFCELDGSVEIILDENELSMAKWIKKDEIKEDYSPLSLTSEMIQAFKGNRY
ncbi:NAD(+) diphosphatase [Miniphocaeibacter massiliensis]|uniref:NAD(+) diphosphatase n=1 Tax=Miniphocaeibacter massiliensis TaxID=2041841 RepID=UPI000C1BE339|nr:NAD(+) diphosphatase [Miniphocaeibacter massiliensis]